MFENNLGYSDEKKQAETTNEGEKTTEKDLQTQMTRRGFLKMAAIFGAGIAVGKNADVIENFITRENNGRKDVEDNFWFSVIETVSRQTDEEITPQDIRAHLITKLFNIPQGWTSGLSTQHEIKSDGTIKQERMYPKLDQLIATYFTNKTVVVTELDNGEPVISTDFRDFRDIGNILESFKEEVEQLDAGEELGMKIYTILEKEYEHLQNIYKKNKNIKPVDIAVEESDKPIEFAYLPGGNPVFLRGYTHSKKWQSIHGEHLADTYKDAKYIAIESGVVPIGDRLQDLWADELENKQGHYAQLMKGLVKKGFSGLFFDIDARDYSKIVFDSYFDKVDNLQQVHLPDIFYEHYFLYLQRENPRFTEKIGSSSKLKQLMLAQTTADSHIPNAKRKMANKAKTYDASWAVSDELTSTTLPSGNELGQMAFADAMAALKLHILAQNINDGHVEKGIIVDFEGAEHVAMKSFYLKYPQYAAEIVLRTIHEVMAGYVGNNLSLADGQQGKNNSQNLRNAQKMLDMPNWFDIIQEIKRIPMAYVENDPNKTVDIGLNQKKMKKYNKLDTGTLKNLDTSVVWALFDDKYIQAHIDGTKSYVNQKNNEQ